MSAAVKSWLLLAVIFVVGIVTGSALTVAYSSHFQHPPGPHEIKKSWLAHLTHRLKLTDDQQTKIVPILTDAEARIRSLHHDEMERGSQIIKEADDQIAGLLTPDQKVELQKMESEREKMFSTRLRPWAVPREGPGIPPHENMGAPSPGAGPDDGVVPPPPPPLPPEALPTPPPPKQ